MESQRPHLEYAPPPRWRGRRRNRAMVWAMAVLWLGLGSYWLWVGYLGERAAFWYWQHQAARYSLPPGTPVYTTDPALAAKLLGSGRGYDSSAAAGSLLHPQVWEHVSDYGGLVHGLDAPLFLHSRTRPDGVERLAAVRPVPTASYAFSSPTKSWQKWELKIQPLTFWASTGGGTQPLSCVGSPGVPLVYTSDDRVTIFAGQPDPSNASHFTIGYSINGHPGTLDGWLQSDDSIRLVVRDGPLGIRAFSSPSRGH